MSMRPWNRRNLLLASAQALVAACLVACGGGDSESSSGGTLSVGTSATVNAIDYRLSDATIQIEGAESATLATATPPSPLPLLQALTPGEYSVELEAGWVLERQMGTTFSAVTGATLTSMNPQTVTVIQGQVLRFGFVFDVAGVAVDLEPAAGEIDQGYD